MAHYFVGDIQGCYQELVRLLDDVHFDPAHDTLFPVGDLVARGPDSLSTAKLMLSLGQAVKPVLGNHDLHLIAVYHGLRKAKKKDLLDDLLNWSQIEHYIDWLRQQPLVRQIDNVVVSHAGWHPDWSLQQLLAQSNHVNQLLSADDYVRWLPAMYGDFPNCWQAAKTPEEQFRFTISACTRMRYLTANRSLNLDCKTSVSEAPAHLSAWFDHQSIEMKQYQLIFGHWAALLGQTRQQNVIALDTGCVWGNSMTLYDAKAKRFYQQAAL